MSAILHSPSNASNAAAPSAPDALQFSASPPRPYTRVAVILHWASALFILLNLSAGFLMETFANPSPQRNKILSYHASVGLLIFGLMTFRLAWRITHPAAPLPPSIPKAQQIAAHGLHWLLYLLILLQPLSGYLHRMAGGHAVSFFGLFNMPALIGKNEPLRLLTDTIHDCGGFLIAILIAGHIAVALKHRYIDRDTVMQRMIPRR
jgi:cytochrome b561